MLSIYRISVGFFFLATAICLTGCSGSDVGSVTGIITMDSKPLVNATVAFHPEGGRASGGKTDEQGKYSLNYVKGQTGALIGEHRVTISTLAFAEENRNVEYDDQPKKASKGSPETMPNKYRVLAETELKATVKAGDNEINFDLTSK